MLTAQSDVGVTHSLLESIADARRRSDSLFDIVKPEFIAERPIPERHRIIFYIGHLEAFDWNLLHEDALHLKGFDPSYDRLFAFGIDPVGGGLPSDKPSDWPSLAAVRDYVRKIRAELDAKLPEALLNPASHGRDGFGLETLLNVAIEHRLMHAETLAYMFHQLPLEQKMRQSDGVIATADVIPRMIEIPSGTVTLGLSRELSRESQQFGWDNEFEAHTARVPAFEIDEFMVTNGQFLSFIDAGDMRRARCGTRKHGRGRKPRMSRIQCSGEKSTANGVTEACFRKFRCLFLARYM